MRVICAIPSASGNIGGVTFVRMPDGNLLSEEISESVGRRMLTIPGFSQYVEKPSQPSSETINESGGQSVDEVDEEDMEEKEQDETEDKGAKQAPDLQLKKGKGKK